jgi:hypothetical protein
VEAFLRPPVLSSLGRLLAVSLVERVERVFLRVAIKILY